MMYRKISCRYWLITVGLIAAGLAGLAVGFYLAISLCTVQVWHFAVLKRSMSAFPVQVRLAYMVLLVCGLWESLRFLYWIQLIGTSAMVLVDYCVIGRILSLMPWNLREPLSLGTRLLDA